jgi:hypothetical protein
MIANPVDDTLALFSSVTTDFGFLINAFDAKIIAISAASNPENNGNYKIVGLVSTNSVSIKKILYTEETILNLFRADITGNLTVSSADIAAIQKFIYKDQASPGVAYIPATTYPNNRIGTSFKVIKLVLEDFADRFDDYHASGSRATSIHVVPNLFNDVSSYQNNNFLSNPINFSVTRRLAWYDYQVQVYSGVREVLSSFTSQENNAANLCSLEGIDIECYPVSSSFNSGKNDILIPNNLIIGDGQIKNKDGSHHKVDFETGIIVLEIPGENFDGEKSINIFTDFVLNYSSGFTRLGYEAMRFADCSYVSADALSKNQVRFNVSAQAFASELDGNDDVDGYSGVIVDGKIGVYMDYEIGVLFLNFSNLSVNETYKTLSTKIQVQVMLKKSGFNNRSLFVDSIKIKNILGLI